MIHKLTLRGQPISVTRTQVGHDFQWRVDWALITEEEAQKLQSEAGFAPEGYGFYRFNQNRWISGASCD